MSLFFLLCLALHYFIKIHTILRKTQNSEREKEKRKKEKESVFEFALCVVWVWCNLYVWSDQCVTMETLDVWWEEGGRRRRWGVSWSHKIKINFIYSDIYSLETTVINDEIYSFIYTDIPVPYHAILYTHYMIQFQKK